MRDGRGLAVYMVPAAGRAKRIFAGAKTAQVICPRKEVISVAQKELFPIHEAMIEMVRAKHSKVYHLVLSGRARAACSSPVTHWYFRCTPAATAEGLREYIEAHKWKDYRVCAACAKRVLLRQTKGR